LIVKATPDPGAAVIRLDEAALTMRLAAPVVWFEIAGRDLDALTRFYGDLLGWKVDPDYPQRYGMVDGRARVLDGRWSGDDPRVPRKRRQAAVMACSTARSTGGANGSRLACDGRSRASRSATPVRPLADIAATTFVQCRAGRRRRTA
jgi:hypothetical protein